VSVDYEFEIPIAPEEIDEKDLENRGRMPSGYYKAECTDCYPDQKDGKGVKVVYKITAGVFEGREITDTVYDPENSEDDDKRKSALQRMLIIFKRLGCRNDSSNKVNLRAAIGKQVVLHMSKKREAYCRACDYVKPKGDKSRKCPTCGGDFTWAEVEESYCNIEFDGVYPFDHPKIPANVRESLKLGPPRSDDGEHSAAVPAALATPQKPRNGNGAQRQATATTAATATPSTPSREAILKAAMQDL